MGVPHSPYKTQWRRCASGKNWCKCQNNFFWLNCLTCKFIWLWMLLSTDYRSSILVSLVQKQVSWVLLFVFVFFCFFFKCKVNKDKAFNNPYLQSGESWCLVVSLFSKALHKLFLSVMAIGSWRQLGSYCYDKRLKMPCYSLPEAYTKDLWLYFQMMCAQCTIHQDHSLLSIESCSSVQEINVMWTDDLRISAIFSDRNQLVSWRL